MKTWPFVVLCALVATHVLGGEPLYTREGTDPSFASVLESPGVKAGDRFSKGPVLGSRIKVNHDLLDKQVGKSGPIPEEIGIHTQVCGDNIHRKDFGKWTRWYQEDGNVQVFRLFEGEQNVRSGTGKDGTPGRIEAFSKALTVEPGAWREWEATYTIVKPVGACMFQVMHAGENEKGEPLLWPVHIDMTQEGDVVVIHRRPAAGVQKTQLVAKNMVGKSIRFKVRSNGEAFEVHQKPPLDDGPWQLVTKGNYAKAKDNQISFRWGMYCGSKKGHTVPNDALLLVTGVTIR